MKVVLIGPGYHPIPPVGWGAVETLIWDYYENLTKRGFDVTIINEKDLNKAIHICNSLNSDVVHIMYDDYAVLIPHIQTKRILYTCHFAYITHPDFQSVHRHYFDKIFKVAFEHQNGITINAISQEIIDVYRKHGYKGRINHICNGAREDLFRFTESPEKGDRSIYIAKVEYRKCQYRYQTIEGIDFVGNYQDSPFIRDATNYLGEWNKATLYDRLTDYGNMVLLSEGEADSLVLKEALMSGLGLVINEKCKANLDLTKPFITVIADDKLFDLKYISEKIQENREYSIAHRTEIREYGTQTFSWETIVDKYIKTCLTFS